MTLKAMLGFGLRVMSSDLEVFCWTSTGQNENVDRLVASDESSGQLTASCQLSFGQLGTLLGKQATKRAN